MLIFHICYYTTLSLFGSALDMSLRYTFFSYIFSYSYIHLFVYSFLYVCSVIILLLFVLVSTDQLVKSRISLNLFSRDRFYTGLKGCYGSLPYLPDR